MAQAGRDSFELVDLCAVSVPICSCFDREPLQPCETTSDLVGSIRSATLGLSSCLPGTAIRTSPGAGSMSSKTGLTLYTAGTPNGWKASILLEELGIPYRVHAIAMAKNEQKEPWFIKINPNGRIPAIVDHDEGDLPVFESGAIMIYLAEKHGKCLPTNTRSKAEVISWLMFQMGGLGPMQGQAAHFVRFAPEQIEQWLAAGEYTIADIANFSWMYVHQMAGITLDDLPHVQAWMKRIEERPAVRRGIDVPEPFDKAAMQDPKKAALQVLLTAEQRMTLTGASSIPKMFASRSCTCKKALPGS
ncbi:hypothetical protein WJX77_011658 [Trebouxia sp. C0004]